MKPVPWGSNEWVWRRALAEQGRLVRASAQFPPVLASAHFTVEITFFMSARNIQGADLDNLAKPVLDTLFRSRYPQVKDLNLTGAIFEMDDDRVFRLLLEKRVVSTDAEQGVDIIIAWE